MVKRTSAAATPRPASPGPSIAAGTHMLATPMSLRNYPWPWFSMTPHNWVREFKLRHAPRRRPGPGPRCRSLAASTLAFDSKRKAAAPPVLLRLANVYLPSRLDSRVSFSRNRPALPAPSRASLHPDERPVHGTLPPPLPPKGSGFTHLSLLHTGESSVR